MAISTDLAFKLVNERTNTLTKQDRCDRCPAEAKAVVVLLSGEGELLFCTHHFRQHKDALNDISVWAEVLVARREED
jgi:hypothetical protein